MPTIYGDSDNMSDYVIIIDTQTKKYVSKPYLYRNRNKARARADALDMEYGAYRYKVVPFDYSETLLN